MDYFPHDTKAMSDDKLLALRIKDGLEAVACYWVILEKIYADEQPFDLTGTNVEATSVLLRLGVGLDTLQKYVSDMVEMGLLVYVENIPNVVMSERAEEQIRILDKKRETARQNGKMRSSKPKADTSRKQRRTNVGTDVGAKSAAYKTLNDIGSYKKEPISVKSTSDGADAVKTAPPSVPRCPMCDLPLRSTGMTDEPWWCDNCLDSFADEKVVR